MKLVNKEAFEHLMSLAARKLRHCNNIRLMKKMDTPDPKAYRGGDNDLLQ
jgi:hypothetical protein